MDILTPFQDAFLKAFSKSRLADRFYMTGGTALSAFFLQHRLSEDLDFFTADPAAMRDVADSLDQLTHQLKCRFNVKRSFPNFLDGNLIPKTGSPTKLDFAVDSPFRLKPLMREANYGILIDDELDICCNKLSALFDRAEPKDFVDVYFILKERLSWSELLKNAQKKHVGLEPHLLAKAFLRVEDIEVLPRLIKPVDLKTLRDFFLSQARRLMDQLRN